MDILESFDPSREYIRKYPNWRSMPVHRWRKQTGLEIIYDEISNSKLKELWNNWNKMPNNMKEASDKKCIELYGINNKSHYEKLIEKSQYDGFDFILHKHNPRNGSTHFDLRFMDLKNNKLLHSFACPSNFLDTINRCVLYKTRDHDPRWLTLKSYRLDTIDKGTVDYKIYNKDKYFLLNFNGKIIKGTYQLFKLNGHKRNDLWLLIKKK